MRDKIIDQAKKWLGLNGNDRSHKPIVDLYNAHTTGYKLSYSDAWCDCFVSAVGIACNCSDVVGIQCYCPTHINWFKNRGQWAGRGYRPDKADVIFFDWQQDGESDHVGYVVSCDGQTVTTIEGNKGNAVGYRYININDPCIVGYGLPAYKEDKKDAFYFTTEEIATGSTGLDVYRLQLILKARGYYTGKIDRSFGLQTKDALKRFQKASGLTQTGKCDRFTWDTLLGLEKAAGRYKVYPKKWSIKRIADVNVLLVQEMLKGSGYYTGKLTWNFNLPLKSALKAFQKATKKLTINGESDIPTLRWLIGD